MSEGPENRSGADRAQQEAVVFSALTGSPGDQRQKTPVSRGEWIDGYGPREGRPEEAVVGCVPKAGAQRAAQSFGGQ